MGHNNSKALVALTFGLAVAGGCGDDGTGTDSATSTATTTVSTGSSTGSGSDPTVTGSGSGTDTSGSGSATMTGTTAPTTGDPTTGTDTTTDSGTGSSTTTMGVDPGTSSSGTDSTTSDGTTTTTGGPEPCQGGPVIPDKTFLWAANSSQGTISKIDTTTVTEVGRYIVRPDSAGSPSRTSVSLLGDVAVANRNGGVTKIYSDPSKCQDTNGMPGIQTSNSNAFLPWGVEECIAWYTPFAYASQRPVAWGAGTFNEETCQYEGEELWTSGNNQNGSLDIMVLDGDTGSVKEMIAVPTGGQNLNSDFYGIYGAAVDPDGNFWGSQLGSTGKLLKVNRADMSYKIYNNPAPSHWYGMTVDSDGIVYLCSNIVGRFDPVTESWTTAQVGGWTGCMADSSPGGLLWMSNGQGGVVGVNRDTLVVEKTWPAAGSYGISVDFDGNVWAVANGSTVSKIDPNTGQFQTYNGLTGAYTYSDMIGYSLAAVVHPQ